MKPIVQVVVRMPPNLYAQLKRQAEQAQQSLNAWIVQTLERRDGK